MMPGISKWKLKQCSMYYDRSTRFAYSSESPEVCCTIVCSKEDSTRFSFFHLIKSHFLAEEEDNSPLNSDCHAS